MLMAFFSWWYGAGWRRQSAVVAGRLAGLSDTFSFSLLLRTLFSPFRQISAGSVAGPLGIQLRAWFDRTISRFIGAMVRTAVMIAGLVVMMLYSLIGILSLVVWPLLPLMPLLGAALWLARWTPWS